MVVLSLGEFLWSLLVIFFMVVYFMMLIEIIADVFRRREVKLERFQPPHSHSFFHHRARAAFDLLGRFVDPVCFHQDAAPRRPADSDPR